jgi:predicted dithiol-disulfide oxidoreductase (DUF899 family)
LALSERHGWVLACASFKGAAMSKITSTVRFPGESDAYRAARDDLLLAEMELRAHVHKLTELRSRLPLGGEVPEDYVFEEAGTSAQVSLSGLFQPGRDSLVVYSFMYGPAMNQPCPMCTSFLDSLDGAAPHVAQRTNLAVVAKSPAARLHTFAQQRGWRHLRLLSSASNPYNRDYHGENAEGDQLPSLNVFVRRDGKLRHFYHTELLFAPLEPGRDPCHIDLMWPLWNVLDLTPEGRGTDWYPKLEY